jgi:hypothetical protein
MHRGPFLSALAALLLVPAGAAAQSEWEQQVLDQIRTMGTAVAAEGYALVGDVHTGSLYAQASDDFNLTLQAGIHYVLVAVCDNDCPDIDLALYDGSGDQLDSDYQDDAYPVVEASPNRTASYRVHVYMADCTTGPCFYGVGVYAPVASSSATGGSGHQNYQGALESSDDRLAGNYFDTYTINGSLGDLVVVELTSTDFDTYLGLVAPSGNYSENDDFDGSTARSRIERRLDEAGEWTVVVTSYQQGATGAYQLSITTRSSGNVAITKGG